MQSQHVRYLKSCLETMDETLEQYEMLLEKKGDPKNALNLIRETRKEIGRFLARIGVHPEKKDIYWEINTSCIFFEDYLTDMEPTRFQKSYGRLDSKDEEEAIERQVAGLKEKIAKLEKACKAARRVRGE
jgi:hypothetical protein